MTGYIILYAAIIISTTPNTPNHPHGIQNAWLWLSRVMSLDPRPDITATVLYHFIQVTGYALSVTYGRQFFKLIQYLHDVYLPKILAVTMDGASGPVTRLQGFLQDLLRTRKILPPKGLLQAHFWTRWSPEENFSGWLNWIFIYFRWHMFLCRIYLVVIIIWWCHQMLPSYLFQHPWPLCQQAWDGRLVIMLIWIGQLHVNYNVDRYPIDIHLLFYVNYLMYLGPLTTSGWPN